MSEQRPRHHWWQWRSLSQPQRVEQYTLQTLNGVLWAGPLITMLSIVAQPRGAKALPIGLALIAIVGLTLLCQRLLVESFYLYPAKDPVPWRLVALTTGYGLAMVIAAGMLLGPEAGLTYGVMMAVWVDLTLVLSTMRHRVVAVIAVVVAIGLPVVAVGFVLSAAVFSAPAGLFLFFTSRSSMWLVGVVRELEQSREVGAKLAVAEERLRFSRDMHDVLGRQLSAIAVHAELAAALAERGDPAAAQTMQGVRGLANDALRETRELARGYRAPDLEREIEGARSLLSSAGIDCQVDLDDLPSEQREAAAWVIREAITNVLRHSDATWVSIAYADQRLRIRNDGVPPPKAAAAAASSGSGLDGLAERLAKLGGHLVASQDDEMFELEAQLS